jgi:hypothetical protein
MLKLQVLLGLDCCVCGSPMTATLECEGDGLNQGDAKALVKLPCPHCHQTNQVIFVPDTGEVIDVMREFRMFRIPEPSLN